MGNILSQEEVDSLLQGMCGGELETETDLPVESSDVGVYDFHSGGRTVRGKMPSLQIINERFAGSFRTSLSNALRNLADISIFSTDVIKFGEFIRSLPVPASLHVFRMEPLRGHGIFVMEGKLVFSLVDLFLGGAGAENVRIESRDFTAIEDNMIQKVVKMGLKDFESAWNQVHELSVTLLRSETNPQFATIVPADELVIVIRFDVELEKTAGNLLICIPYSMIEPIRTKLTAGFQSDHLEVDAAWKTRLQNRLEEAMVNMVVSLGSCEMTGRKFLELKVGDIIHLDKSSEDTVTVDVEGEPKFYGVAGLLRGKRAIEIKERISRRSE